MPIPKQPTLQRLLHSKLVVIFELLLLVGLGLAVGREMIRRHQIQSQIDSLESQAVGLEKQNTELSDLINMVSTPNYQEEQARLKLGMQKPGESVVAVLGANTGSSLSTSAIQETTSQASESTATNPQRWLDYFLHKS
ncbi:MAG: septum formation initiator family protein [Patescibacteria group bacterium]